MSKYPIIKYDFYSPERIKEKYTLPQFRFRNHKNEKERIQVISLNKLIDRKAYKMQRYINQFHLKKDSTLEKGKKTKKLVLTLDSKQRIMQKE